MDAIIERGEDGEPREPEWPEADVIVGNPPFLGGKRLRTELDDDYVDDLFRLYSDRVARESDLVTYWFEKTRRQIEEGKTGRAGLLATNSIRGGANRRTLQSWDKADDLRRPLFASLHEAGHALYEQGIPEQLAGTPPGRREFN